jgi:hypothetical protein
VGAAAGAAAALAVAAWRSGRNRGGDPGNGAMAVALITSDGRRSGEEERPVRIGMTSRLWRLRKLHQQIDAELQPHDGRVDLRFLYNGALIYTRQWESADVAIAEATEKRTELERAGWAAHW